MERNNAICLQNVGISNISVFTKITPQKCKRASLRSRWFYYLEKCLLKIIKHSIKK